MWPELTLDVKAFTQLNYFYVAAYIYIRITSINSRLFTYVCIVPSKKLKCAFYRLYSNKHSSTMCRTVFAKLCVFVKNK